ncbi:lipopolysaccharide biosynthesis protein [Cobetia marina]|uniref:lipopolysaccharide biosynthesis protein n=1 Tax=Cobetia marina TaxID=28258 RepID=UPI0010AE48C9|nr:lipopolysaccharide biosynthesis protein [Cobetia marina]TKD62739.1 lipopolysaccharide biosynthesis protein [Cobetia marina]
MSLTKKTTVGILWNFVDQLLRRGMASIVTLLLARLLLPEDFGLMAMVLVFLTIASAMMDSGFQQAILRLPALGPRDASTAFFSNIGFGVVAYVLLYLSAPLIADFYAEPRLVVLVRIGGLVVLINAFEVIQGAMLNRALDFRTRMKAGIPGSVISGSVAVLLGWLGFGVWALAGQMLTAAFVTTALLWWWGSWRPRLTFDMDAFKAMFSFGYKMFLSRMLDVVFVNLYVLVIAKLFSASVAGLFFFADRLKELVINQLVTAIQNVTFPALASIQHDPVRLKDAYRRILQLMVYLLFPGVLLMAALARPLFEALFPDRWLDAVPYLQLMCIAAVMHPLSALNLNVLQVKGRSDLFLGLEVIKKLLICVVLVFTWQHGVIAILIGQIVVAVLSYIPNAWFSRTLIDYSIREQCADFLPSLMLSSAIALCCWLAVEHLAASPDWSPWAALLGLGCLSGASYLLLSCLLRFPAWQSGVGLIRDRLSQRKVENLHAS